MFKLIGTLICLTGVLLADFGDWLVQTVSVRMGAKPKPRPLPFKLTDERLREITDDCDDTAGYLVKDSTIRYIIEREVNKDRKNRG